MNAPSLVSALGFCSACGIVREDDGNGIPITDCVCTAKQRHKPECRYVRAVSCPVVVASCAKHDLAACEECDCDCGTSTQTPAGAAVA